MAPVPWPAVAESLAAAYGPLDADAFPFASVEHAPLASASLAQVHRAVVRTEDRAVVLKVLRPGIDALVQTDLDTVSYVLGWASRHTVWGRRYDLSAIAREFAAVTRQELDMPEEGARARRFRAAFADDPRVGAPAVEETLTRPGVLVMEEVHGVRPDRKALEAAGIAPGPVADILLESYMRQWLTHGLFHADPHAGNLFVEPDGRLVYVDFGMMAEIGPEDQTALRALALSVMARDAQGAVDAMEDLGILRQGIDRRPLEKALDFLLARMFDPAGAGMQAQSTQALDGLVTEMRTFLREHPFRLPARYTFLGRAIGMLAGIAADLRPDQPFMPALAQAAQRELARPGRRTADRAPFFQDLDPVAAARALLAWLQGDPSALANLAQSVLPAWRRLTREPVRLRRLLHRLAAGELVVSAPAAPAARAGSARGVRAILAAGTGIAAAVLGAAAPVARDLLWCGAAVLALWALVAA